MIPKHHTRSSGRQRRSYRRQWTAGGLVLSMALVPLLVAAVAAPALVLTAGLGAVTAIVARTAAERYRTRSTTRGDQSSAGKERAELTSSHP